MESEIKCFNQGPARRAVEPRALTGLCPSLQLTLVNNVSTPPSRVDEASRDSIGFPGGGKVFCNLGHNVPLLHWGGSAGRLLSNMKRRTSGGQEGWLSR